MNSLANCFVCVFMVFSFSARADNSNALVGSRPPSYNVLGIYSGMPCSNAIKILQQHAVGRNQVSINQNTMGGEKWPAIVSLSQTLKPETEYESITIFCTSSFASNIVYFMKRQLDYKSKIQPSFDDLYAGILEKYGRPDIRYSRDTMAYVTSSRGPILMPQDIYDKMSSPQRDYSDRSADPYLVKYKECGEGAGGAFSIYQSDDANRVPQFVKTTGCLYLMMVRTNPGYLQGRIDKFEVQFLDFELRRKSVEIDIRKSEDLNRKMQTDTPTTARPKL